MNNNQKILFFFTAQFPNCRGEQFLFNEIEELSNYFEEVNLLPLYPLLNSPIVKLPINVKTKLILKKRNTSAFWFAFRYPKLFLEIFCIESFQIKGAYFLKKWALHVSEIANAIYLSNEIIKHTTSNKNIYFHSTWMNEWALALAILYKKKKINNFSFKMRGYDLYDERRSNNFMPFRKFIFRYSNAKITVSEFGAKYLEEKGFKNIRVNYSGIKFNNVLPQPLLSDEFILVSCSNLIALKRVDLIAQAISHLDIKLKWIHFGGGPELEKIKIIIKKLPQNITAELRGEVSNNEVINYYENNYVDAFIHLSETEGFGFSILEAFSFGIPAILYPGGAVIEFINPEYCIEVSKNDNSFDISKKINYFLNFSRKNPDIRQKIIMDCSRKFNKVELGKQIYKYIVGI